MEKTKDNYGRWRNRAVSFRLSQEESELLNELVKITGLTKQEYITRKLLNREIRVYGNSRVYKMLWGSLEGVLQELKRLKDCGEVSPELLVLIEQINNTLYGMKAGENDGK